MEEGKADADQQQRAGGIADDREDADAPSGAIGEQDSKFDSYDGNADGRAGPVDVFDGPSASCPLR